ncbi:MAG: Bug family tripartite tricarboxylate transporter substrate binding protein [Burkholderiales bacterium]
MTPTIAQVDPTRGYPSKPIRLIEPQGAGGLPDIMARGTAQAMTQALGQAVVVENRAGAEGIIAMETCAKAPPDGYTLCIANNSHMSINPILRRNLPYEPVRDFAPVAYVARVNGIIIARPDIPANSMRELVAYAKTNPGKINWASTGTNSFAYLTLAWIQSSTGAEFFHVPYKTSANAQVALLAGDVHITQTNPQVALQLVKSGKVKALLVTGRKRSAMMPEVPSFFDVGFDLDYLGWYGLFAPSATPRGLVQRLNDELNKIVQDPEFSKRVLTPLSAEPNGGSTEEFAAFLKADRETAAKLVKIAGLKAE